MLAVGDESFHDRVATEDRLPSQQEIEGAAKAVDVGTVVGRRVFIACSGAM